MHHLHMCTFLWQKSCHVGYGTGALWDLCRSVYNATSPHIRETISPLTHWGRVTHICVDNLTIIGSDNGLSPGRRQAIIWTNAWILLIGPLGTNFSEVLIKIHTFSFRKMYLKMSSGKRRPFCLGLNVLRNGLKYLHYLSLSHYQPVIENAYTLSCFREKISFHNC